VRTLGALGLVAALTAALGACTSGAPVSSGGSSPPPAVSAEAQTAGPTAEPSPTGPPLADWLTEPLTDVRTGATVSLADLRGRVVLIEGMATWCPPCLEQQRQAAQALAVLDPRAVVYVSVDIDPREPASTLAAYALRTGFDWPFLVPSLAFLRAWSRAFGSLILDPPTTPIVVIDRTGHGTLTETGIKPASRLVQLARAAGA
jgi:thiol-disulfide isomerase/thioredoxin